MPHASHRIDLLVLPVDPNQPLDESAVAELLSIWGVDDRGRPGDPEQLMSGGCKRVWVDRPQRMWLYGNQSGGFHVRCPETGESIARDFGVAHRAWKTGGPRAMVCPSCGSTHPLEYVQFVPPAAFARWAVVFSDASSAVLSPDTVGHIEDALGRTRCIIRRP